MWKFIEDILKTNGKWSFKRTTALYSLNLATIYAFIPLFIKDFETHEFVFWGFITYSGAMVGLVLQQKIKTNYYDSPSYTSNEPLS